MEEKLTKKKKPYQHREFIFVGESIPEIDPVKSRDFILKYQKSILLTLVKKDLLTHDQVIRCMEKLEKMQ